MPDLEQNNQQPLVDDKAITASRFVVFLDIMGFKDKVAHKDHGKMLEKLMSFQGKIASFVAQEGNLNIQLAQFSDSIVLFSADTKIASLHALARITTNVMIAALGFNFPLKGAIAKGKVTCDLQKQLFFGQALIDAYLLQEDVKSYSVLVHHTAEVDVKTRNQFREVHAYLKTGRIIHRELYWYGGTDNNEERVEQTKKELQRLRETVSNSPRVYIDNTLSMISE
jgi:hypothetical protein